MEKESRSGLKFTLSLLGMLLLAGVVTVAILRDRIVNVPQYQVSVIGQGKIQYQPDIANIGLGVQIDKVAKADEALGKLNEKMNGVLAAVKSAGIAPEDIQTQAYSLQPQYDFNNGVSTSTGFMASQQLLIKVKDIKNNSDKVNKVIAEATKAGANQVTGVSFDLSNLEELKQQARLKAINDAKGKAEALASSAGVKLDRIIGWWENFVQYPGLNSAVSYDMGKGGAMPAVTNGNQEIVVEVNLSYRIK